MNSCFLDGLSLLGLRGLTCWAISRVKLPKSFVAVNLSDAFSWPKHSDDDSEEGGLQMKTLQRAKSGEQQASTTAAQDLVTAISEAAMAAEEDVPRV